MATSVPRPILLTRRLVLALLLALAAAAWAVLLWQGTDSGMDEEMSLTMGMDLPLFLAIWIVMMVAMMFPTAAPMILTFTQVQAGRRARGQAFVPAWVFVGAYLLVWTAFGATAYAAAMGAERLADQWTWLMDQAPRVGGLLLVTAGVYQLSPLKRRCLSTCRSPMQFIVRSWRDGYGGALRMGLEHGAYCLGCCWLLFVILFPLGVMNVAAMALITLFIFAEKSLPAGVWIGRAAAVALVAWGVVVVAVPAALPTAM